MRNLLIKETLVILLAAILLISKIGSLTPSEIWAQRPTILSKSRVNNTDEKNDQPAQSEWTVLSCLQGHNNIESHALRNIKAMLKVGSTDKVAILAQIDARASEMGRYHILKDTTPINQLAEQKLGLDPFGELCTAVEWAHKMYPSKKFLLILWNHGNGVLDEPKPAERGIFYNYATQTYLTNELLEQTLRTITTTITHSKIDILGMDACLMASLEVAYQIRDYANLFIASENVEPAPGWDYSGFLKDLVQNPNRSSTLLARSIVNTYWSFKGNQKIHCTLSCIKLKEIDAFVSSFNNLILMMQKYGIKHRDLIHKIVIKARSGSIEFEEKYIDLKSFLKKVLLACNKLTTKSKSSGKGISLDSIKEQTKKVLVLLKKTMLCQAGDQVNSFLGGLTLYYPRGSVHPSYLNTNFAQETEWLVFLQQHPFVSKS